MPQSLSKVYIHLVFSTKGRTDTIPKARLKEIHAYLAQILNNNNCSAISVGGIANHVHLLFVLSKTNTLANIVRLLKSNSSKWINEHNSYLSHFGWQDGYGAFSVSQSQVQKVVDYIENQETHHHKKTFKEEYKQLLDAYGIGYDEKYMWD